MLNTTTGKPRLTKPSKYPLFLGIIWQIPVFKNVAIPNPPLKTDKKSETKTVTGMSSSFDTSRQIRMWICGVDSKNGSERNIEYVSESYLQKEFILQSCGIFIKIQKNQKNILMRIQKSAAAARCDASTF